MGSKSSRNQSSGCDEATIVIAAEKLLPRPEITGRLVGITAIFTDVTTTIQKLNQEGILPTDTAWLGLQ